jgi:hypothetical protein
MTSEKVSTFFKQNWYHILCGVIASAFVLVPYLVYISQAGPAYQGLNILTADAETHYLARIKEAGEGKGNGNPFIQEYKHLPDTFVSYSESILALPLSVLPIEVTTLNLFYKAVFPFIIAVLLSTLLFRLTHSKLWAYSGALIIMLGYSLMSVPDLLNLIQFKTTYSQFIAYARPVNPQFTSIFFLAYLHLLLSLFTSPKVRHVVWLGLILAASAYLYFYLFTFLFCLHILITLYFLYRKNPITKSLALSVAFVLILDAYFFYQLLQIMQHEYYTLFVEHVDLKSARMPQMSMAGLVVTLLYAGLIWKKYLKPDPFLISLLVTTWLVINQQVITGVSLQSGHYHWYYNTPIYFLIFLVSLKSIPFKYSKVIPILILLASVSMATLVQYSSYKNSSQTALEDEKYVEVVEWLEEELPESAVILANNRVSAIVPIISDLDVLWEAHATYYLLPAERRKMTPENIFASGNDIRKFLEITNVSAIIYNEERDKSWNIEKHNFVLARKFDKVSVWYVK